MSSEKRDYGYVNNKTINYDGLQIFRDIPCNKSIYYAITLMYINNVEYNEFNILEAMTLKLIKDNKISFKEDGTFIFSEDYTFDNDSEKDFFGYLCRSNNTEISGASNLSEWYQDNKEIADKMARQIVEDEIHRLKQEGHIYKSTSNEECYNTNIMDDKIYEDTKQLFGLKKFFDEFTKLDKDILEIKLWEDYLVFASLFGIAKKVEKNMQQFYPKYKEEVSEIYDVKDVKNKLTLVLKLVGTFSELALETYIGI